MSALRTHAPASRPRRILARISAARRFQFRSGGSTLRQLRAQIAEIPRRYPGNPRNSARAARAQETVNAPVSPPASSARSFSHGCFMISPIPSLLALSLFRELFQLDPRIGDMRTHRSFGTIEPPRHFFGRQIFHIPQHQRGAFPRRQALQSRRQPVALFGTQHRSFRSLRMALGRFGDLAKAHPAVAAQKIDAPCWWRSATASARLSVRL